MTVPWSFLSLEQCVKEELHQEKMSKDVGSELHAISVAGHVLHRAPHDPSTSAPYGQFVDKKVDCG